MICAMFGLYIHMPWCIRKCPYCDFNSHQLRGGIPEQQYLDALIQDLESQLPYTQGKRLSSIFIGGGTPSLFSAEAYEQLLSHIHKNIDCENALEITLEANPGTVEQEKFKGYREIGINRLSLGIQTLNEQKLKVLGRIHNADESLAAITMAKNAGFDNFNCDIMFGLPDQTIDEALYDLKMIIAKAPTHLSWYQLTLEPNTHFYKRPPVLPNDDYLWEMQEAGQQLLKKSSFEHYEISAYARDKLKCQHNLNYWQFGDYLGIGAGAHAKITDSDGKLWRYSNHKSPQKYMLSKDKKAEKFQIDKNEVLLEYMLNAARLYQPISMTSLIERTQLDTTTIQQKLAPAIAQKLIQSDGTILQVTALGHRYLNNFLETL